jgi:pyrroline-5-carboxylate reductase
LNEQSCRDYRRREFRCCHIIYILLIKTGRHPEQEIDKVTTPKGCTIAGLNEMEHQGFSSSLIKGIAASFDKINHK